MIIGTGIDLVEIERLRHAMEKFGDKFLARVLRPDEIAYCRSHRDPAPFVGGRFAAKEAISKAFGTGIGGRLGWQDMEIVHQAGGRPAVVLHGDGLKLFQELAARELHISISHTAHHATAVAILEQ